MIDLGTTLVDPAASALTLDEMGAVAMHYDLPIVLDVAPREGPARDDPTTIRRLSTLASADWILAIRRHTGTRIDRLCIAGSGDAAVVAIRRPDAVVLADLLGDVGAPVLEALGHVPALQFDAVNLRTEDLATLADAASSTAPQLRTTLRVEHHAAQTIATALRHNLSHTQIVGIKEGIQFEEHLTVFDSDAGRVLVTSTVAADRTRWSSLTPGTSARIGQALRSLVEATRRFSPSGCPAPG